MSCRLFFRQSARDCRGLQGSAAADVASGRGRRGLIPWLHRFISTRIAVMRLLRGTGTGPKTGCFVSSARFMQAPRQGWDNKANTSSRVPGASQSETEAKLASLTSPASIFLIFLSLSF